MVWGTGLRVSLLLHLSPNLNYASANFISHIFCFPHPYIIKLNKPWTLTPKTWVAILTLPLTKHVTLSKALSFSILKSLLPSSHTRTIIGSCNWIVQVLVFSMARSRGSTILSELCYSPTLGSAFHPWLCLSPASLSLHDRTYQLKTHIFPGPILVQSDNIF